MANSKARPKDDVIGQTVKKVRWMTEEETEAEGWGDIRGEQAVVIELGNGVKLYPSRDPEGNGPGALFGVTPDGKHVYILPPGTK